MLSGFYNCKLRVDKRLLFILMLILCVSLVLGNLLLLARMSGVNGTTTTSTEGLVTAKAVAMVALGGTSLVTGAAPILLARCCGRARARGGDGGIAMSPTARTVANLLLSFGGGALLSTTFLHLMHEVEEGVDALQASGDLPTTPFPLPQFIMCCGFFAIYLVEEVVHLYVHGKHHDVEPAVAGCSEVPAVAKAHMEHVAQNDKHTSHSHLIVSNDSNDKLVNSIRGFLIVLALSIHELFEGLAVGLEPTAGDAWYMVGAVAAHKLVIAFCVSVELVSTHVPTWLALVYTSTFSLVTPLGIGAGLLLTAGAESGVPNTVLQGLATGTLLYVVFFEILQRQRHAEDGGGRFSGLRQLAAVAVGFAVMMLLLSTVGHEHEHSE